MPKATESWKKNKPLYRPVHSSNPKKKGMVYVLKDGKKRLIHFGDSSMKDFTQHKDPFVIRLKWPTRKPRSINASGGNVIPNAFYNTVSGVQNIELTADYRVMISEWKNIGSYGRNSWRQTLSICNMWFSPLLSNIDLVYNVQLSTLRWLVVCPFSLWQV